MGKGDRSTVRTPEKWGSFGCSHCTCISCVTQLASVGDPLQAHDLDVSLHFAVGREESLQVQKVRKVPKVT